MPTDTDTFTFTRDFPVEPTRMWTLLTHVDFRSELGAPHDGMTLTTLSEDFTVGGTERHRCGPEDAAEFEVETRWYHIAPPEVLVYSETIEAGGARLGASLVTTKLEAGAAGGTTVDFTVAVSSFVGPEMMEEFKSGWEGGLIKLDKLANAQT